MSRLVNIPPLQSVTEAGATSDQATAFSGGLASTLPAVSNLTVTSSVILGGTPSFSVLVANNVLDSLVHIGTGNTLATYLQLQSAFDNDWVIIGNDNTQGASGPTSNVVSIGSSNILYSNNLVSVGNSNTIGVSGVGNDASTIVNFGNANNYDADSSSNICVGYGNDFQGSLATGSMVIGGSGNTIANNGVLLFGLSGYTTAHNNCTIIGGGGTNPPASTAQGEFIFGSTTARYILPGFIPDDKYLYFGASSGAYSRIYRDSGTTNLVIEPDGGTATGKVSISGSYTLPNADGSANHVLKTDGAGALGFAAATTLVPPGGSTTQIQYNNAGAFGGMSNFTFDGNNIDFTSGDMRFDDNVDLVFGTGNDAKIYYDGTDLIIDPTLVGSGVVKFGASSNAHIQCDKIGLGTTAYSANNVINYNQSGGSRIVLNFQLDFTGTFTNPATIFAETTYSGTGATSSPTNIFSTKQNTQKTGTFSPVIARNGFATGFGVTSAVTIDFNCLTADWNGNGTGHSSGTLRRRGFICSGWGTPTGVSSLTDWGGFTDKDWCLADNTRLYFEGSVNTKGDTYMVYTSASSALDTVVNGTNTLRQTTTLGTWADAFNFAFGTTTGTKIGTATTQKLGFWNVTPVTQYATTGTSTGFTAGAGTNVQDVSTFTGNTGSTAYTIGDIVRALKLCGVMAA